MVCAFNKRLLLLILIFIAGNVSAEEAEEKVSTKYLQGEPTFYLLYNGSGLSRIGYFHYKPNTVFTIICHPLRATNIELEKGEIIHSVTAGDTENWMVDTAPLSGDGANLKSHVVIKPLRRGPLETNIIIYTSRRVYILIVRNSDRYDWMACVAWKYPSTTHNKKKVKAKNSSKKSKTGKRNYRYQCSGKLNNKHFQLSVFDDGRKTYIKIPEGLSELPVLYKIQKDKVSRKQSYDLVNYRVRDGYFIADQVINLSFLSIGRRRDSRNMLYIWNTDFLKRTVSGWRSK